VAAIEEENPRTAGSADERPASGPPASRVLAALTGAALALPGLSDPASAATPAETQFNAGYYYYDEGGRRMTVKTFQQNLTVRLGDAFDMTFGGVRDAISGASPIFNLPRYDCAGPNGGCRVAGVRQVLFTRGFEDVRDEGNLKLNYYWGDTTIGLGGGASNENDYASDFVSLDVRQEFNDKLTTLAFGWSLASDEVTPANMKGFYADKTVHQFLLGVTQVLDKNTYVQANVAYSWGRGYLTDPYKAVYVADLDRVLQESRPGDRHQWNGLIRLVHYFPGLRSALHFDYRYTVDTWGMDAHTFEASWNQSLGSGWAVTPTFRYYSQDSVDFYGDYFASLPDSGHYSSDYRLAAFGAVSGGLRVSKTLFERLRIDAGFEYYDRQSDLALGSHRDNSFADYSYALYNVGFNLKF
jgi:hypothetical protein